MNNPLRYVDPDGWKDEEYEPTKVKVKGENVKIEISKDLSTDDRAKILINIKAALARIDSAKDLSPEQTDQLHKLNGIQVSARIKGSGMNKDAGIYRMTAHSAFYPSSTDQMAAAFLHDTGHVGQSNPVIDSDEFVENERKASSWAFGVAQKIPLSQKALDWLEEDSRTGHLFNGKKPPITRPEKKKP
jgi:hypothetical protein